MLTPSLRDPESLCSLDPVGWDLLIRQARAANLLGALWSITARQDLLVSVPPPVRRALELARLLAAKQERDVRWEIRAIHRTLDRRGIPMVALKGSAYLLAQLPCASGRLFADIDIMVPRGAILDAEKALMMDGWYSTHHDDYDQRYYRQWMHELPPLRHLQRRTVLDVHHTILPLTARLRPDAEKLLASARPVEGFRDLYVLGPADMVLHSATHLFHDGELENGLRDLRDLGLLLDHFGTETGFWAGLTERARELGLSRPLFYGLRYCRELLATPVPAEALAGVGRGAPPAPSLPLLDALFWRGLRPAHGSCSDRLTPLARSLLYLRSHWLRMPPRLLVPHLLRKALRRR